MRSVLVLGSAVLALSVGCDRAQSPSGPPPPPPPPPPAGNHAGYYVTTGGSSSGDGSAAKPWDLATALAGGNGKVAPGDTIWLRVGTYVGAFTATLTGTSAAPVVVRAYPGERATIDGSLKVDGAYAIYWGFELMQSNPVANGNDALDTYGPNCKFVNLIVHDAGKEGISYWESSGTSELYGSLFYNNGTHEGFDHGIYAPNDAGVKYITDNVVFNNLAYGIHVYASTNHPVMTDEHIVGNVSFDNGAISQFGMYKANLLIGADVTTQHMTADSNLLYFAPGATGYNLRLGIATTNNVDIAVHDNYASGDGAAALLIESWQQASLQGNTLIGPSVMVDLTAGTPPLSGYAWTGNAYYRASTAQAWRYNGTLYSLAGWQAATGLGNTGTAATSLPTTPQVFVRPNKYESGRATIIIYNWSRQAAVGIDLSKVLTMGTHYEVRNVQAIFGAAVASGTYGGGTISIPMTGMTPPAAIGRSTATPPTTGPAFDVFIVTSSP